MLSRLIMRVVSKTHSGPIPSADELEHLERVQPGPAERCIAMAEREQAHRHPVEAKVVTTEIALRGRGQLFALIALIVLIAAVAYLASLGLGTTAASLGAATIVGVVAVFITGCHYDAAGERTQPEAPAKRNRARHAQDVIDASRAAANRSA
ncbi:MAG: DUF2335 domain-containing protein [Sphingomonadaceae bacterium]|nr:DUF2335 domain-containing protein [Sphingomonadaceae bacterium]